MTSKRQRGRPRGRSFPDPRTVAEAVAIACFDARDTQRVALFVAAHEHTGLRELARLALFTAMTEPVADKRRLLAMVCRIGCEALGAPFCIPMLREWFRRRGLLDTIHGDDSISTSTLSKLVSWASAPPLPH